MRSHRPFEQIFIFCEFERLCGTDSKIHLRSNSESVFCSRTTQKLLRRQRFSLKNSAFGLFFGVTVAQNQLLELDSASRLTVACGSFFRDYRSRPLILILHVASESVDLVGSRSRRPASVAQLAERLICNQQVAGSSPAASSRRSRMENRSTQFDYGELFCTDVGVPGGGFACRPNRRGIG